MTKEPGGAALLVAALLGVGALLSLLVADIAEVAAVRAQLIAAADASALAAAPATFASFGSEGTPEAAAAAVATANGANLVGCVCQIDRSWRARTVVTVAAATADLALLGPRQLEATAAAEFRPVALGDDYSDGG